MEIFNGRYSFTVTNNKATIEVGFACYTRGDERKKYKIVSIEERLKSSHLREVRVWDYSVRSQILIS